MRREFGRYGIDPSSPSFKSAIRKVSMDKARARSGASTSARERAETENFNRLNIAMGVRGGAFGAPGQSTLLPAGGANVPLQASGVPGGPGFSNVLGASQGAGSLAGSGVGGLSNTTSGRTTTSSGTSTGGGGETAGGIFGTIAGLALT